MSTKRKPWLPERTVRLFVRDGFDFIARLAGERPEAWQLPRDDRGLAGRLVGKHGQGIAALLVSVGQELGLCVEEGDGGLAARIVALGPADRAAFNQCHKRLKRQGMAPDVAGWHALAELGVCRDES